MQLPPTHPHCDDVHHLFLALDIPDEEGMIGEVGRRDPGSGISLKSPDKKIVEFGGNGILFRHVGVPVEDKLHERQS